MLRKQTPGSHILKHEPYIQEKILIAKDYGLTVAYCLVVTFIFPYLTLNPTKYYIIPMKISISFFH